jgi:hypothetical protein
MKLFQSLMILTLCIVSCDDPSLNQQIDDDAIVEPTLELTQLSSIEIAQDLASNVIETVNIIYDQDELVSQVSFNGVTNIMYDFEYAGNNRLETITKTDASSTLYNLTYSGDSVFLEYTDLNGDLVEKQIFTDIQNRINRVVATITDTAGNTTQTEDLRYQYTANFNVSRINSIGADGFTVIGYSEFTYEFNNNPFRDMNDVIRLIIFSEFIPYTRYLPVSRVDYTAIAGSFVLDRSYAYSYVLQDDKFPSSREILINDGGSASTTFEFFNYL